MTLKLSFFYVACLSQYFPLSCLFTVAYIGLFVGKYLLNLVSARIDLGGSL